MPSDEAKLAQREFFLLHGHELESQSFEWGGYRISYFLKSNPASDKQNEDALAILKDGDRLCLAVADGAGGHPRGKDASVAALQSLEQSLISNQDWNMGQLVERANQNVLDLKAGARCTFSCVGIEGNLFRSSSVGDSEVHFWNSQGTRIYSSVADSPVGFQVAAGTLSEEKALNAADRNVVNHLLGDEVIRYESCNAIEMKRGHFFLLASDGLFDNYTHSELAEILVNGALDQLLEACAHQDAKTWKKNDDVALIFVKKLS